jgi:hypothetical protein
MKEFLIGLAALSIFTSPIWGLLLIGHLFGPKIVCIILVTLFAVMMTAICYDLGSNIIEK